ncbi:cytochrome P450 [Gonapodya prolifera JEL478]|uniref:Cytochrome P450 n=1 Tax=Gonapodya prolifera (strain JEL478) TaxID=1344416 RepID=A0A139ABU6_GONPJ|nr:cytochrome P450 [Gonapodya prolifera JEL478]|eukprot:KXS13893.1 cytochrome P450 [Gonapodya prolifera JEL478]
MGAGSETSASTMAWATHLLLSNPDCLSRLRSELTQAASSSSQPGCLTHMDLKSLPYLNAVIKETLRLRPAATRVMREMDITVTAHAFGPDGVERQYHIPEGTGVEISIYSLQRNPQIWLRASEFWPERWLEADAEDEEDWGVVGVIKSHVRNKGVGTSQG